MVKELIAVRRAIFRVALRAELVLAMPFSPFLARRSLLAVRKRGSSFENAWLIAAGRRSVNRGLASCICSNSPDHVSVYPAGSASRLAMTSLASRT